MNHYQTMGVCTSPRRPYRTGLLFLLCSLYRNQEKYSNTETFQNKRIPLSITKCMDKGFLSLTITVLLCVYTMYTFCAIALS